MNSTVQRHARTTAYAGTAAALALAIAGAASVTAPGVAQAQADAPTMPKVFTSAVAPVPSLLASTGGRLSLTEQSVAGLAQARYGQTPGLSAKQAAAVQLGFASSLAYPAATTGTLATPVASAVGVLTTGNTLPESNSAPGCSSNQAGQVSRVTIVKSGSSYRLVVTKKQVDGFAPSGSWTLPTYSTGAPYDVHVLDPNCAFSSPSAIAVTFPGGIDYYSYNGSGTDAGFNPEPVGGTLRPTTSWLPGTGATILASAHRNADESYLGYTSESESSANPQNAEMLAAVVTPSRQVSLHHLRLDSLQPGTTVSDAPLTLGTVPAGASTASLAYDNDKQRTSDFALAVRTGAAQSVWFGTIFHGNNGPSSFQLQPGACAGGALPKFSIANVSGGSSQYTGVACTNTVDGATRVEQRSSFVTGVEGDPDAYPGGLRDPVTVTLPLLTGVTPQVVWPCDLLSRYGRTQTPTVGGCNADMSTDVTGNPAGGAPRLYQLPTLDGQGSVVSRPIAGGSAGRAAVVDTLPLDDNTIQVENSSTTAVLAQTKPTPVVYLMPAPMVAGLVQPSGGPPTTFGTTTGSSSSRTASFTTSVGATVSATIGVPEIAAAKLEVSAEQANGTSNGTETSIATTQALNNNGNEPSVVYLVTPVWQWTGTVTRDSTGLATTGRAKVITQIPVGTEDQAPMLRANSVDQLASRFPQFRENGIYGPTLLSVFGAGVYGGAGTTVADADPAAYPRFVPGRDRTPTVGGAPYCDTHTGSTGVVDVNSGVRSPYTPTDRTASGPSFLTPGQGFRTVDVGDSLSDSAAVTVGESSTSGYSTSFSVNASAGLEAGGVSVTADVGFTQDNETSVTTSRDQTFGVEIGHIKGASGSSLPAPLEAQVNQALRGQGYNWLPFVCHRTTSLTGGGQTSSLVLGFATQGFTGLADVGAPKAPLTVTGTQAVAEAPTLVRGRSALRMQRRGFAAAYQAVLVSGGRTTTLITPVLTPVKAAKAAARPALTLPRSLTPGLYKWRPVALTYNGDKRPGVWRFFRVK